MDDRDTEELGPAGCLLCAAAGAGCIGVGILHGAAYGFLALAAACALAALVAVASRWFG